MGRTRAWCETWAPACPIGTPGRVATLVGYREREPGRLQRRAIVRSRTEGICAAIVEEDENTVHDRLLLCWEDRAEHLMDRDYVDCPVHVDLQRPLNGRTLISVDDHQPLPRYAPRWEIEHNRPVRRQNRSGGDAV